MEKIKKKRRIVTIRTVIISIAVAALLCGLFAFCFWKYMVNVMKERCMEALDYSDNTIQRSLNQERVTGQEITLTDFRCMLIRQAFYRISIPLSSDNSTPELMSGYSEGCYAYAFAWDEEGNRVVSSSLSLQADL